MIIKGKFSLMLFNIYTMSLLQATLNTLYMPMNLLLLSKIKCLRLSNRRPSRLYYSACQTTINETPKHAERIRNESNVYGMTVNCRITKVCGKHAREIIKL